MTIERLDRNNPPPGWAWYDERQQYVADIGAGRPGLLAVAVAWTRHEAQNDPPGMRLVWEPDDVHCEPLGAGDRAASFGLII